MTLSRRRLLVRGGVLSVGGLSLLSGCAEDRVACVDEEFLGAGEAQMRKTLAYTDQAAVVGVDCAACEFFSAEPGGGYCGNCEILGGIVTAGGHCTSFAVRS